MVGAIWNPLAPAPIMATRLPARSTVWSQRAEWNGGPGEALLAGDVGDVRPVQLADGRDHGAGHERRLGAVLGRGP